MWHDGNRRKFGWKFGGQQLFGVRRKLGWSFGIRRQLWRIFDHRWQLEFGWVIGIRWKFGGQQLFGVRWQFGYGRNDGDGR